jgi:uncharacterized protein YlxP (DUF503 family)
VAARVGVLTVDLRLADSHSLKDKRAVVRTVLEGAHRRYGVSVAETAHQDRWQRAELAFATVSGTVSQVEQVLDTVERFVWSFPEVEVLACDREHLEVDA